MRSVILIGCLLASGGCNGKCVQRRANVDVSDVTLEGEPIADVLARVQEPMLVQARWHDGTVEQLRIQVEVAEDSLYVLNQRWREGLYQEQILILGERCPDSVRAFATLSVDSVQGDGVHLRGSGDVALGRLEGVALGGNWRGLFDDDVEVDGVGPLREARRDEWDRAAPNVAFGLDEQGGSGFLSWEGESCTEREVCGLGGEPILEWPPPEEQP